MEFSYDPVSGDGRRSFNLRRRLETQSDREWGARRKEARVFPGRYDQDRNIPTRSGEAATRLLRMVLISEVPYGNQDKEMSLVRVFASQLCGYVEREGYVEKQGIDKQGKRRLEPGLQANRKQAQHNEAGTFYWDFDQPGRFENTTGHAESETRLDSRTFGRDVTDGAQIRKQRLD